MLEASHREPLAIESISKSFTAGQPVLNGVDIVVAPGELLVVLGESGCGKTTLLRILAGLEQPDQGRIRMGGDTWVDAATRRVTPPERRDIGLVFQNYALWPHLTVEKNVAFPLEMKRVPGAERKPLVSAALELVRCGALARRYPAQLSGGQQQRVALARALVASPRLLLLDEPLSNLDAKLRVELRRELRLVHQRLGFTGLLVTHDQGEALQLADQIVVMQGGLVEQVGTPEEIYNTPATTYVAEFLGIANGLDLATDLGRPGAEPGETVYFRPGDTVLLPEGDAAPGDLAPITEAQVVSVSFTGPVREYVLAVGARELLAEVPIDGPAFPPGATVLVAVPRRRLLRYRDGRLAVRDLNVDHPSRIGVP
jgi:iron(III) transport system ATP-binding protein